MFSPVVVTFIEEVNIFDEQTEEGNNELVLPKNQKKNKNFNFFIEQRN